MCGCSELNDVRWRRGYFCYYQVWQVDCTLCGGAVGIFVELTDGEAVAVIYVCYMFLQTRILNKSLVQTVSSCLLGVL